MGPPKKEDWTVIGIWTASVLGLYFVLQFFGFVFAGYDDKHWTLSLFLNLLGYSTVFIPGYLVT